MKNFSIVLILASLCIRNAAAATWYFLRWNTPSSSVQFQKFSMQMMTPTIQKAGVYYLWPGLQDTGNTGVYQEVLDGRTGSWWIAPGWCCSNPSLPWGDGFAPGNLKTVDILMVRDTVGANWTSTLTQGTSKVTNKFPLSYKNFNQAILAIELTGVAWDFGQLAWNNVVMVMNTTSTSWCTTPPENYNSATRYTMTTPKATVSGSSTTCTIDQVVMTGPA